MFSVFQIPIIDVRKYVPLSTDRLIRPAWPIPEADHEFVRQFGIVRERYRGGITSFAGEEIFCQARNAIRLQDERGIVLEHQDALDVQHNLMLRRFYFDGRSVAKLELGFKQSKLNSRFNRRKKEWLHTINALSNIQCIIAPRQPNLSKVKPLVHCGPDLSSLYLRSTTNKMKHHFDNQSWWLNAGEPVLLFEYEYSPDIKLPKYCKMLPVDIPGINIGFQRICISTRKLNVWYLSIDRSVATISDARSIRLHLLRFHAEVQCLKVVLRMIAYNKIPISRGNPSSDLLQEYLLDASRLISKSKRYGVSQSPILQSIRESFDFVSAGERASLLQVLVDIRKNVFNAVANVTKVTKNSEKVIYVLGNAQFNEAVEIKKEGDTMTNFNIKFGDHSTFHRDFVVANSIQGSFNLIQEAKISDELKQSLEDLAKQVTEVSKNIPNEKAQQMADDLSTFTKEVTKKVPRKAWYDLSAKGMIEAAKAIEGTSGRIVNIVKKILELLG